MEKQKDFKVCRSRIYSSLEKQLGNWGINKVKGSVPALYRHEKGLFQKDKRELLRNIPPPRGNAKKTRVVGKPCCNNDHVETQTELGDIERRLQNMEKNLSTILDLLKPVHTAVVRDKEDIRVGGRKRCIDDDVNDLMTCATNSTIHEWIQKSLRKDGNDRTPEESTMPPGELNKSQKSGHGNCSKKRSIPYQEGYLADSRKSHQHCPSQLSRSPLGLNNAQDSKIPGQFSQCNTQNSYDDASCIREISIGDPRSDGIIREKLCDIAQKVDFGAHTIPILPCLSKNLSASEEITQVDPTEGSCVMDDIDQESVASFLEDVDFGSALMSGMEANSHQTEGLSVKRNNEINESVRCTDDGAASFKRRKDDGKQNWLPESLSELTASTANGSKSEDMSASSSSLMKPLDRNFLRYLCEKGFLDSIGSCSYNQQMPKSSASYFDSSDSEKERVIRSIVHLVLRHALGLILSDQTFGQIFCAGKGGGIPTAGQFVLLQATDGRAGSLCMFPVDGYAASLCQEKEPDQRHGSMATLNAEADPG